MALITEMLQESCRTHARKTALRHKVAGRWVEYSYATIWSTSDQIAAGLVEWGLEAGDRVALLAPSSPVWVMAYFGILKSSAIAVPIDKDLKQGELRHIIADCGARVLFTEQSYLDLILDIAESLPQLEKIVLLNQNLHKKGRCPHKVEHALALLISEWHRLSQRYKIKDADIQSFEGLAEDFHQLVMPTEPEQADKKKNFFTRLLRDPDEKTPVFSVEST